MSVYCRNRDNIRVDREFHYLNFDGSFVDGKLVLKPVDPVAPALASEHSVSINALTSRGVSPLKKRINVDALDLKDELNKIM